MWQEHRPSARTPIRLEEWASGALPMLYNVGAVVIGDGTGVTLIHKEHRYVFAGTNRAAQLAGLLLRAYEELNAHGTTPLVP